MSDAVVEPADRLLRRIRTGPATDEPSAFLATGTVIDSTPGRTSRSPCQPLLTRMSPAISESIDGPPLNGERPRFGHFVPEDTADAGGVDGTQEREGGRVFDLAARIARGQPDVVDDDVMRVGWVEFPLEPTGQPFVWPTPGRHSRHAQRLSVLHDDADHVAVGHASQKKRGQDDRCDPHDGPVLDLHDAGFAF